MKKQMETPPLKSLTQYMLFLSISIIFTTLLSLDPSGDQKEQKYH